MEFSEQVMYRHGQEDNYVKQNNPQKRLISAPYLYCTFAWSIIISGIGTYISSLAYLNSDAAANIETLKIIGPLFVAIGGLLLFAMCVLCLAVFRMNQVSKEEEILRTIGGSTFYDNISIEEPNLGTDKRDDNGIRFLEVAVTNEIRRKHSQKTTGKPSYSPNLNIDKGENLRRSNSLMRHPVNPIIQVHPNDNGSIKRIEFANPHDLLPIKRPRSRSTLGRQNTPRNLLRRNVTLTPAQARIHKNNMTSSNIQLNDDYPPELHYQYNENISPYLSLRSKHIQAETPIVHQLPSFRPDIIQDFVKKADNQSYLDQSKESSVDELQKHYSSDISSSSSMSTDVKDKFQTTHPNTTWNMRRDLYDNSFHPSTPSFRKKRRKKRNSSQHYAKMSSVSDEHASQIQTSDPLPFSSHESKSETPPPSASEAGEIVRGIILGVNGNQEEGTINNTKASARLSVISEIGNDDNR